MLYRTDALIFGLNSRKSANARALSKKYYSILLVKNKDKWSLPGEYVEKEETSKEVALNIIKRETGLDKFYIHQLTVKDSVNNTSERVVAVSYMSLVDRSLISDSLSDACWFDVILQEINNKIIITLTNGVNSISYRVTKEQIDVRSGEYKYIIDTLNDLENSQDEVIIEGIMELRNKVKNTDIVFNLMPELFTIGELKQIYEIILNKKLINSVFRRTMASKIEVTDTLVKTGGHRPSFLCKYKGK